MNDPTNYDGTSSIVINKSDRDVFLRSPHKCPFLKIGPIIPFANRFYGYCTILKGKGHKEAITIDYIEKYCCNNEGGLAFMKCKVWQESPVEPPIK